MKIAFEPFSISHNRDVEDFLKTKAINFEKRNKSRTYLFLNSDLFPKLQVVGYYTLALKAIEINSDQITAELRKRLISHDNNIHAAFL